jgi:hypothetical protein
MGKKARAKANKLKKQNKKKLTSKDRSKKLMKMRIMYGNDMPYLEMINRPGYIVIAGMRW